MIDALNCDSDVHGIFVQQPFPKGFDAPTPRGFDAPKIISCINPIKDVDCLTAENFGLLAQGRGVLLPCTPAGVIKLLQLEDIEIKGKHAVVVGASDIVGKPLALMLLQQLATVTVCHIHTKDLAQHTRQADILCVAVGKPNLITPDMIKPGAVIIDIGINKVGKKICGDVDFDGCKEIASYITPVPGGVGSMTIAMLIENCINAWKLQND